MSNTKPITFLDTLKTGVETAPGLISLILLALTEIAAYANFHGDQSWYLYFLWLCGQAISGLIYGRISDRHCRRLTLLVTHGLGIAALICVVKVGWTLWSVIITAIVFNPAPIVRASVIDNYPYQSKVKLIASTWIAVFLPWSFYILIAEIHLRLIALILSIAIACNFILALLLFRDHRDRRKHKQSTSLNPMRFLGLKSLLVLAAFLLAQLVFFTSDAFLEEGSPNNGFFSVLGVGSLAGSCIAVIYRRIPHLSLLTVSYGFGLLFSVVTWITSAFIDIEISTTYLLTIIGALGGFYLPFVYDAILTSAGAERRGFACGIIELIMAISSVVGVIVVGLIATSINSLLFGVSLAFLLAVILQRAAERYHHNLL